MNEVDAQRIALRNLAFDIRHERVRRRLLRSFVEFVEENWLDQPRRRVPESIIKRFARMADPPPKTCRGKPRPSDAPRCSRIMEARSLWYFHVTPEAIASIEDDISDEEIERFAIVGLGEAARGELRSELPFAWITKSDEVDGLRGTFGAKPNRPHPKFATALRDALGLYHYIRTEKLVEVVYPPDCTKQYVVAPPTFLEGLDLVYRSDDGGAGWGRTFPLSGDVSFPEAIHEPIPMSGKFEVRAVGRPDKIRVDFEWRNLAGEADLVEEVESLIEEYLSHQDDDD